MNFGWDRAEPLFSKLRWPDNLPTPKTAERLAEDHGMINPPPVPALPRRSRR